MITDSLSHRFTVLPAARGAFRAIGRDKPAVGEAGQRDRLHSFSAALTGNRSVAENRPYRVGPNWAIPVRLRRLNRCSRPPVSFFAFFALFAAILCLELLTAEDVEIVDYH